MFAWALDPTYRREKNQLIFDFLEQQSKPLAGEKILFSPKKFTKSLENQNNCELFQSIAPDTLNLILSYLNIKTLIAIAQGSQLSYNRISFFAENFLRVPSLITKTFGKNNFLALPNVVLPPDYSKWVNVCQDVLSNLEKNFLDNTSTSILQEELYAKNRSERHEFPSFSDYSTNIHTSLAKTSYLGRPGLLVRMSDTQGKIAHFAIIYFKEKQLVIGPELPPGIWMFLNDMHVYKENLLVEDYLKRLFEGELCGEFPANLNKDAQINYETGRAANTLIEGPLEWKLA